MPLGPEGSWRRTLAPIQAREGFRACGVGLLWWALEPLPSLGWEASGMELPREVLDKSLELPGPQCHVCLMRGVVGVVPKGSLLSHAGPLCP